MIKEVFHSASIEGIWSKNIKSKEGVKSAIVAIFQTAVSTGPQKVITGLEKLFLFYETMNIYECWKAELEMVWFFGY